MLTARLHSLKYALDRLNQPVNFNYKYISFKIIVQATPNKTQTRMEITLMVNRSLIVAFANYYR